MPNNNKQNSLIRILPDITPFRKGVSALKIKMTTRYSIPQSEIIAGENDQSEKNRIVNRYMSKWPKAAKSINRQIKEVFSGIPLYLDMQKDPNQNAKLKKIRIDMIFCFFAYGFTANEYFSFRLKDKSMEERSQFISSRQRMVYRCQMNDLMKADIFNDKTKTYQRFKKYYHRNAIAISKPEDFERFHKFVNKYPIFVKKQCFEAQGNSVELINMASCEKTEQELFNSLIAQGKHILEEQIVQSPELSAFNESSVNTVRAITFVTRNGVVVPYCTLRTGRPGSFVDNGGAGGVQACIDFTTGTIITEGFDEIGGVFADHPASGTTFKGYKLPDWEQLQSLVTETATVVPEIHFIGWDLAHTKDGWVIVEGNENCYIIAKQMIDDKGLRDVFEGIMQDMDLIM